MTDDTLSLSRSLTCARFEIYRHCCAVNERVATGVSRACLQQKLDEAAAELHENELTSAFRGRRTPIYVYQTPPGVENEPVAYHRFYCDLKWARSQFNAATVLLASEKPDEKKEQASSETMTTLDLIMALTPRGPRVDEPRDESMYRLADNHIIDVARLQEIWQGSSTTQQSTSGTSARLLVCLVAPCTCTCTHYATGVQKENGRSSARLHVLLVAHLHDLLVAHRCNRPVARHRERHDKLRNTLFV